MIRHDRSLPLSLFMHGSAVCTDSCSPAEGTAEKYTLYGNCVFSMEFVSCHVEAVPDILEKGFYTQIRKKEY